MDSTVRLRLRRHRYGLSVLIGLCLSGVAFGADLVGAGGRTGFGSKQVVLLVAGLFLILRGATGLLLMRHQGMPTNGAGYVNPRWVAALGTINLVSLAVYSVLSYGMAPLLPFGADQSHNEEFFAQLAHMLGFLGGDVGAFVSGRGALENQQVMLLAYLLPVTASTCVSVAILMRLANSSRGLQPCVPQLLFRWAVVFAAMSALASPVLVHDFWYPLAWGRMVWAGVNPYYIDLTAPFTNALPLNSGHERMMYGPLLAMVSGIVMGLGNGNGFLGAAVFKLLLLVAWIGSLGLIWDLLRGWSLWHQSVGLVIFGWLPLGVIQGVADGHNDVFVVFFMVLWLYCLERGRPIAASVSLTASVLVKYVTVPLFLLDVLYLTRFQRRSLREYWPQFAGVALYSAMVFAPFFRSLDFFSPVLPRTAWHFFSPREAVLTLENWLGVSSQGYSVAIAKSLFPVLALYAVVRFVQRPGAESFRLAGLSMMSAALFGYITGLWPWYLIWVLGWAALIPSSAMARWVVGVVLVGPFLILTWVVFPNLDDFWKFDLPALALYALPLGWLAFMAGRRFPGSESEGDVSSGPAPGTSGAEGALDGELARGGRSGL